MTGGQQRSFFDQFALGAEYHRAYKQLEEPRHSHSIQLIDFWHAREADGGLIVGRDIPSRAISDILRSLMVCEPIADFSDFRIRLAGTAFLAHYGCDVTGKLMSEIYDPDVFKHNCAKAREVVQSGQPEVLDANLSQFGISRRHYEVVQLPVWGPNKTDRWLLCGIFRFE